MHQGCGCSDSKFVRIDRYTVGSRNAFEGVDTMYLHAKSMKVVQL